MSSVSVKESIIQGAFQQSISLSEAQSLKLSRYVELLTKWNKAYNLTAVRDPIDMVSRHILDSLSVSPHITAQRFLDVGSGPGLPGIPLAILFPEKQFTCLDSNGKKTRFMVQAANELMLDNINVINHRVEALVVDQPFDAILSRAFSSLKDMIEGCYHLLKDDGLFLAMKGQYPEDELRVLTQQASNVTLLDSHILDVPGCEVSRHLMVLKKQSESL